MIPVGITIPASDRLSYVLLAAIAGAVSAQSDDSSPPFVAAVAEDTEGTDIIPMLSDMSSASVSDS